MQRENKQFMSNFRDAFVMAINVRFTLDSRNRRGLDELENDFYKHTL